MVDYSDMMDIVRALVIGLIIVAAVLIVLAHNAGDRIENDITPADQPDVRTHDAYVQYSLDAERNIRYDVTANIEIASKASGYYLFVLRLRDIDVVAGCVTAGGTTEIPCRINGNEQFYPFQLHAQFTGSYDEIPPIVNISRYGSTTFLTPSDPNDGLVKFGREGQTFLVGNYSVYVTQRDKYEIGGISFRKKYRVSVSCPGDSKIYSMNPEEFTENDPLVINICEGEVKIAMPEDGKIKIDTYRGREWTGEGEKIGVFVWKYEEGFYCGELTQPVYVGQPFNTEKALTDKNCMNKFLAARILAGDITQGYQAIPPLEYFS